MKNKTTEKFKTTEMLDHSWNLEKQLKEIKCFEELKKEIIRFINLHEHCKDQPMLFSNLVYRNNLHYILENINKPQLLVELKNFNDNLEQKQNPAISA